MGSARSIVVGICFAGLGALMASSSVGCSDDASDTGGAASGGKAQGGSAQGGSAQGGSAQGGSAQGGSAQGGSAQGGSAQGGSAQGGNGGSAQGGAGGGPGKATETFCSQYESICGFGTAGYFASKSDCLDDFGNKFSGTRKLCVSQKLLAARTKPAENCPAAAGAAPCD